jgi:membrane protease YdiL (CAAX protease family)
MKLDIQRNEMKRIGLLYSTLIFGIASILLFFETHLIIPFLSEQTGLEPILFWFLVAGLGMFLPLVVLAYFILRREGLKIDKNTWKDRLRFRKMNKTDWQWTIGSIFIIGLLSFVIMKILETLLGKIDHQPSFMYFEPLTPDRYWLLLVWFPYWLLNIMGEEILWRGVILPRQEIAFGKNAWLIHGVCWGIFHLAFGWQLLLTLLPILFIQSYAVQRRKNSWIGVVIHAVINGPSFIAISFGYL